VVGIFQLVISLTIGWRAKSVRGAILLSAGACVLLSLVAILASYAVTGEYGAWQIRHALNVLERWGAVRSNGLPIVDLVDVPMAVEVAYVFVIAALLGAVIGSVAYGLKRMLAGASA
jgi:hypothetical protein